MVEDRRSAILNAVVQQYIETSQPVGSGAVVDAPGVNASSATVRSEMAALEREGLLTQPHTSAGRVPTDHGYRFFVDQLEIPGRLASAKQHDVVAFFSEASGEIEQMLHESVRLLSNITGAAAVVVGPNHDNRLVRSVQLVSLHRHAVLVVVVESDGSIDKRTLELDEEIDEATVRMASAHLDSELRGRILQQVHSIAATDDAVIDRLCCSAIDALGKIPGESEHVYVGGASRLASAFDAVETVRSILTALEQQYTVVTLIHDLLERQVAVSIGTEHKLQPLAQCSLVVAPTVVNGAQAGSVAVLGPTRMDYSQAIAAVAVVSQQLSERMADGE